MNCKPGDLAYITRAPYIGHFVTVLRRSIGRDTTPDGHPCLHDVGVWMCEKASGTFSVPTTTKYRNTTKYAGIEDQFLRPIRPDESPEESAEAMRKLHELPSKEPVPSHQLDEVKAFIADLNEMRKYRGSMS